MRIRLAHIAHASQLIDPVFLNTPQFIAEPLAKELGLRLVTKVETLNPIRAFKGRGSEFFVAQLEDSAPLVAASAGNFGQALAWSCRARGIPLTLFAAERANPLKVTRMRELGARVQLMGEDFDGAKAHARQYAKEHGQHFVEDGLEPAITEGAGTIGLELLRWPDPIDTVLIPLGNGALLNGIGTWLKAHCPDTKVIGICAVGAPAMERSWKTRQVVETPTVNTIADGIGVRVPVAEALDDMRYSADDVVLVDDEAILRAMRLVLQTMGVILEPAGAVGVAAAMVYGDRWRGQTVATVLCGGNVTIDDAKHWFGA